MGTRDSDDERPRRREREDDGGKRSGGFVYRARSVEATKRRASQKPSGMYDNITQKDFSVFKAREGKNRIRFLPPTWDDPDHYAFEIVSHRDIGADNAQYLCLQAMKGKRCPICDERRDMKEEESKKYRPQKQMAAWIIDRNNEDLGPQLWIMSQTMDHDLLSLAVNGESGEVLLVDHPDEGYDVIFTREGQKLNTEYLGKAIARRESPLSDNPKTQKKWLNYVAEHPVPKTLNYYDADYIEGVFNGKTGKKDDLDDDDDDDTPRTSRNKDKGKAKKSLRDEIDDDLDDDDIPERASGKKRLRSRDDEDDDDEPAPKKKSAKRESLRDDDDDEEDDEPAPKKKRKPVDDDDDEDEDEKPAKKKRRPADDDDDDEEDEPAPKKRKKPPVDDDDEDEDDEPAPKKKKRPPVDNDDEDEDDEKPAKKKKPARDEDEDDDDDDDDEEDDEPAPKKKGVSQQSREKLKSLKNRRS